MKIMLRSNRCQVLVASHRCGWRFSGMQLCIICRLNGFAPGLGRGIIQLGIEGSFHDVSETILSVPATSSEVLVKIWRDSRRNIL
jgi:hypothetical protein